MRSAEYYGRKDIYDQNNKGCSDWIFDVGYGETFGKTAEQEYKQDIAEVGKICGHCLYTDSGFCTFAECYPEEIARRNAELG